MTFVDTLLSGPGTWQGQHWTFVVIVLGYLGLDGRTGFSFLRWVLRGFKPAPAEIQPVRVIEDDKSPATPEPRRIIYGTPPVTGHTVQGREDELAELRAGLTARGEAAIVNAGAVLHGHGGIGKTTLAAHYVARYGRKYRGIVWATAADSGQLAETLKGLAPQLGVRIDNLEPEAAAKTVLTACAQDGRDWLFVYDNVGALADIADLIPRGAHLIVTTRDAAGWDGFACVRTDVLGYETEDAPAVRVLMEAAGREGDAAGARDLAEDLGGLPLALVVAGALIRSEGYAFAAYQAEIDRVIAEVPRNAAYPDRVIGAVKLSYDRLSADARAVADLLAWWAPEGLTPDLLTGAPEGTDWKIDKQNLSEEMIALVTDPARVDRAFQALVDASLLKRPGRADGPHAMHRMTGAALRALQGEASAAPAATALLAAVYPGDDAQSSAMWPLCRWLTPHVRALWATGAAPRNRAMVYLLNQAAGFLSTIGDHAGGLALAEAGFELAEALHAPEERAYAMALHNRGRARRQVGDLDGALRALRRVVELHETHRPGTEELAVSLDQLGFVLYDLAQAGQREYLPEAVRVTQRALALFRRLHGRRSEPVASSLNTLGVIRRTQGRGAAAARLYAASRAIWIRPDVLPEGDARRAYGPLNSGSNLLEAGRADEAEPLFREALGIWRAAYVAEPEHPELGLAAGWLTLCLLVRAAAGEDAAAREAEARRLADEFGLDWAEMQATARQYPYTPAG